MTIQLITTLLAGSLLISAASCSPQTGLTEGNTTLSDLQQSFTQQFGQTIVAVDNEGSTSVQNENLQEMLSNTPIAELSDAEKAGLLLMREEEKLAHDVYTKLYEKWQLRPFSNISQSELTHTEAVKALLKKYGLEDPVTEMTVGVFQNETLKNLYTELVSTGEASLESALRVGAKIEDLDIKDLQDLLKETQAEDIQMVYNNLMRGSRNHMRAFTRQLKNQGLSYTPEYISQAEYDAIIAAEMERGDHAGSTGGARRGPGNGPGNGQGNGMGQGAQFHN